MAYTGLDGTTEAQCTDSSAPRQSRLTNSDPTLASKQASRQSLLDVPNHQFIQTQGHPPQSLVSMSRFSAHLLRRSEANAVGAEVVDGVPSPEKRVTEDGKWASRGRNVHSEE